MDPFSGAYAGEAQTALLPNAFSGPPPASFSQRKLLVRLHPNQRGSVAGNRTRGRICAPLGPLSRPRKTLKQSASEAWWLDARAQLPQRMRLCVRMARTAGGSVRLGGSAIGDDAPRSWSVMERGAIYPGTGISLDAKARRVRVCYAKLYWGTRTLRKPL